MGGGVVAGIFRDRHKPGIFGGTGGGGSSRNFPGSSQAWNIRWHWGGGSRIWASPITVSQPSFRGGGVVGGFFGLFG